MAPNYQFTLKKVEFDSLDPTTQKCLKQAVEVRGNAYEPYSKFKVGASAVTEDNLIFTGCNVENVTYKTICAEQTAYVKAISEGHKKFKSVAVIAFQENSLTPPCGTCRQFMMEFGDVTVYMAKPDLKDIYFCQLRDLLPLSFNLNITPGNN